MKHSQKYRNESKMKKRIIFLTIIMVGSIFLYTAFINGEREIVDLTENGDKFTQMLKAGSVELTADADVFTQKTKFSNFAVYDGSGATPFLRLGIYEFTYDSGGYISEIYVRFNLPQIEPIDSMVLQLTYYAGYPTEADDNYEVIASLVSNDWVEGNTVWTERPEYLGTSTLVYLHNPSLESEIYIDITDLAEGITESLITIHLCPSDLSRIRFPAPLYSSESYGITPKLILEYGDLSNEFENTPPDQNPFLIYIIVGLSSGILGISLIFIYVLKMKKRKTQTLVREIIDNKKIFCPICFTELKQGEKKCLNCENASKENKKREKLIKMKHKSVIQRNKKGKRRDLRKFKNMMLRETIGSFLAPFLIPLLLLTYDFPTEVNIIFIVVVSIVSPLVGLLFLRAYLKANAKYKESLKQVSSSFITKQIHSNSFKKKEIPISEVRQDFNSSRPINEVSKLKTEEFQFNSSISNKIDKELRVNSYTCKTCGKQLIRKASYCPYCGK